MRNHEALPTERCVAIKLWGGVKERKERGGGKGGLKKHTDGVGVDDLLGLGFCGRHDF